MAEFGLPRNMPLDPNNPDLYFGPFSADQANAIHQWADRLAITRLATQALEATENDLNRATEILKASLVNHPDKATTQKTNME